MSFDAPTRFCELLGSTATLTSLCEPGRLETSICVPNANERPSGLPKSAVSARRGEASGSPAPLSSAPAAGTASKHPVRAAASAAATVALIASAAPAGAGEDVELRERGRRPVAEADDRHRHGLGCLQRDGVVASDGDHVHGL